MKRLLLDVDGVIADFTYGYREAAQTVTGRVLPTFTKHWYFDDWQLTKEETKATQELVQAPGFAAALPPLPGAVEAVLNLAEVADVYFVTSSWNAPTWAYDRKRWLVNNFGPALGSKIVSTEHKHLCRGDVFVDDKPANVESWRAHWPRGIALLWDAPYNDSAWLPRARNWDDVRVWL